MLCSAAEQSQEQSILPRCLAAVYNYRMAHPPKSLRIYLAALGKKGAKARNAKLSPAQRREIARRAARVRWAKGGSS
jgi:hypothetical protein